jgi:hypothetical protein
MKLLLKMSGFNNYNKELIVDWDRVILDFPKFAKYDDKYWGWIFYDKDNTGVADHMLLFSEHKEEAMPTDLHGRPFPVSDFSLMFNLKTVTGKDCECGQKGDIWAKHSGWCPKYEAT